MKLKIEPSFWAMTCLAIVLNKEYSYAVLLAAAFIHEIGHLICILVFGGKAEQITAKMGGFDISYSGANSYRSDALIALSGPFANFAAAMLTSLVLPEKGDCFTGFNIMLCLFNLIPIYPLDGGKAVCALFEWISPMSGEKLYSMFSASLAMVLFSISVGACFENLSALWSAVIFGSILLSQKLREIYKESI